MGFDAREISEASGIPIATVYRAVKSGALNLEDVLSVSWYVVGHLILMGDFSGVVDRVVDRSDEDEIKGEKKKDNREDKRDVPLNIPGIKTGAEVFGKDFSANETRKIRWLMMSKKIDEAKAEEIILKNRTAWGETPLSDEALDSIR